MRRARPVRVAALALLSTVLAVLVFRQAIDNDLVWDDPIIIQRQLPYFDSLGNIFAPPEGIPQFARRYYRPLVVLSFKVDEALASALFPQEQRREARRRMFHASPVLFHALATGLVFLLGLSLTQLLGGSGAKGPLGAAVGAVLFAVHPIHVETVSWMAGRTDSLCAVFFLGALLAFLGHRRAPTAGQRLGCGIAAALLGICSMLSKETGVGLLLAIPLIDIILMMHPREGDPTPSRRRVAVSWAALLLLTGLYLLVRHQVLPRSDTTLALSEGGSAFGRLFGAVAWYVAKTIWPPPQSAFVTTVPGGALALGGAIVTLALIGLVVWYARQRPRPGWGREVCCPVIFLASLAPSLAIALFRISETPLAERYLYLPSVGACLLLGFLLQRLAHALPRGWSARRRRALGSALTLLVALPAAYATHERNRVWADDYAFWQDAVLKAPGEALPHLHLGLSQDRRGEQAEAEANYRRAAKLYRDGEGRARAFNNLGTLLLRQGRLSESLTALNRALWERPGYSVARYNRAMALRYLARRVRGRRRDRLLTRAFDDLRTALRINPRYVKAHYQLGRLYRLKRDRKTARAHFQRVIELAPGSPLAKQARAFLQKL